MKHSITPTRVVEQGLGFPAILRGCDELPDETLDVLISPIVKKAKNQDDSADRLHVTVTQPTLTSSMGQDVPPSTPPRDGRKKTRLKTRGRSIQIHKMTFVKINMTK